MTQDEASKEAAKHMGFYKSKAAQAVRRRQLREDDFDDAVQDMYVAACKAFLTYDPAKGAPTTYLDLPCYTTLRNRMNKFCSSGHEVSIEHGMFGKKLGNFVASAGPSRRRDDGDGIHDRGYILPGVEHQWPDLDGPTLEDAALAEAKTIPVLKSMLDGETPLEYANRKGVSRSAVWSLRKREIAKLAAKYGSAA
jgi:DNA-directed RNA polymerase specialized sigma24 family protein